MDSCFKIAIFLFLSASNTSRVSCVCGAVYRILRKSISKPNKNVNMRIFECRREVIHLGRGNCLECRDRGTWRCVQFDLWSHLFNSRCMSLHVPNLHTAWSYFCCLAEGDCLWGLYNRLIKHFCHCAAERDHTAF